MADTNWSNATAAAIECARCARPKSEHVLVNCSNDSFVGQAVLVCPTAIWKEPAPLPKLKTEVSPKP
jgi:hypothetical protein